MSMEKLIPTTEQDDSSIEELLETLESFLRENKYGVETEALIGQLKKKTSEEVVKNVVVEVLVEKIFNKTPKEVMILANQSFFEEMDILENSDVQDAVREKLEKQYKELDRLRKNDKKEKTGLESWPVLALQNDIKIVKNLVAGDNTKLLDFIKEQEGYIRSKYD